MGLRMKNWIGLAEELNFKGGGEEEGGFTKKPTQSGGLHKKGKAWTFYRFKGGGGAWQERGGGVFKGALIPQCTIYALLSVLHKNFSKATISYSDIIL